MTHSDLHPLLPHRHDALWLHSIDEHDEQSIRGSCHADCLQQLHEPATVLLFEAAAQLCAAHGALYAGARPVKAAHLGKLSGVRLHAPLQPGPQLLQLHATRLGHTADSALYAFEIVQQQRLLDGRLLVVLDHA